MPDIKAYLKKSSLPYFIYNLRNGFWKKGLKVTIGTNVLISGIRIKQNGKNNKLYIGNGVRIRKCTIHVYGDNNIIYIGNNCSLCGTNFYAEDGNNEIHIDDGSTTTGKVDMSVIEGTRIRIGKDCMISSKIYIATGDGHSVCDMQGKRTNVSKDIIIGNHVWIGTRTIIGKGVRLGDNAIVAAGSVCTSSREETCNAIIGGNPASVLKNHVNWNRKRL